jgi:hypothetical protein
LSHNAFPLSHPVRTGIGAARSRRDLRHDAKPLPLAALDSIAFSREKTIRSSTTARRQ